jgi:hypothetical protein
VERRQPSGHNPAISAVVDTPSVRAAELDAVLRSIDDRLAVAAEEEREHLVRARDSVRDPNAAMIVRYIVEGPEDYGQHTLGFKFQTPQGVDLLPPEPAAEITLGRNEDAAEGEQQAGQMALNFAGVPILEPGIHVITALLDGEVYGEMKLPAVLVDQAAVGVQEPENRADRRRRERAEAKRSR